MEKNDYHDDIEYQLRQSISNDCTPLPTISHLHFISYIFFSSPLCPKPSCFSFCINVFDLKMFITY